MTDRIGEKYGRLEIISFDKRIKKKRYFWNCLCECGNKKSIDYDRLKSGNTKSCGCLQKELCYEMGKSNIVHGYSKIVGSSEYNSWVSMRERCYSETNHNYSRYGGRGITICDRWLNSFENFIEDMGNKPDKSYTIDRINNDGNYEPNNCKWSTKEEQANNQSTNKKVINIITGEEYSSIASAARALNINMYTLHDYLNNKCKNKTNLRLKTQ